MTEKKAHPLVIYTDGSSRGNPGPGGYGALLIWGEKVKELWGGYKYTTNNRMELMGVIQALMAVTKKNIPITIYTWVKGHAENKFNNRCDELATSAADGSDLMDDDGYEG